MTAPWTITSTITKSWLGLRSPGIFCESLGNRIFCTLNVYCYPEYLWAKSILIFLLEIYEEVKWRKELSKAMYVNWCFSLCCFMKVRSIRNLPSLFLVVCMIIFRVSIPFGRLYTTTRIWVPSPEFIKKSILVAGHAEPGWSLELSPSLSKSLSRESQAN